MSSEATKEEIKFLTETYKLLIILIIALLGGITSLFLKIDKSDLDYTAIFFGTPTLTGLVVVVFYLTGQIRSMIKKL